MNKNKFKIFALDGPWGPSSGNKNRGSGGFSGGNNDSIDDLLKDLKNKYKIKMPFKGGFKGVSFLILIAFIIWLATGFYSCLLYTSPSPRDLSTSRMPSSA